MRIAACALLFGITLPFSVAAQQNTITARISPQLAKVGQSITFEAVAKIDLNFGTACTWFEVRQGGPRGARVHAPAPPSQSCPQVVWTVKAGIKMRFKWNQRDFTGKQVAPGVYWIIMRAFTNRSSMTEMYCVTIDSGKGSTLVASGDPRVGRVTALTLTGAAGAQYIVAASWSPKQPVTVPGLQLCLTADTLLATTLNAGGGIITSAMGRVPASGKANLAVIVPPIPSLVDFGFIVQGVVSSAGKLETTNPWHMLIQK